MSNRQKLIDLIHQENREEAVLLALAMLENKESNIVSLYEDILTHALYQIDCNEFDKECIWREHIKTAIVRTIIEVTYPFIIKEKEGKIPINKKVLVVCPSEEYHEIGAKIAHSFFTLHGFNSIFIGANTPIDVIKDAVNYLQPDYLAISVTNFYNVIKAKEIVAEIKTINKDIKVVAGGQAFNHQDALETINADIHITTYESIGELQ